MSINSRTIALIIALSSSQFVSAQATWTGNGVTDQRWSIGTNWVGSTPPSAGQTVSFPDSASGNAARYNMSLASVQSISIGKCPFSAITEGGNIEVVPLTAAQAVTSACSGAAPNLVNLLDMRLSLPANATINSLTPDAGITNTRKLVVQSPSGVGILAGANLTLNVNSTAGAVGALAILDLRLASGNGVTKVGNGRVDFLQPNVYTGVTDIQAGILNAGNAAALGATGVSDFTTVQSGATLAISTAAGIAEQIRLVDNSDVIAQDPTLAGAGVVNHFVDSVVEILGSAVSPIANFSSNGTELLLSGGINASTPGSTSVNYLGKIAGSRIALGGPTNHGGLTRIGNNMTLQLVGTSITNNRLSNASIIEIDAGGTLNLNQSTPSFETIAGLQGAGSVLLNNMDLTLNSDSDTNFSGSLSGGRVFKSGFNVVTTAGAFNPSQLSINTGAFVLQGNSTAAVLLVGGQFETVASNAILSLNLLSSPGGVLEIGGPIEGRLTIVPTMLNPSGITITGGQININLSGSGNDQLALSNANNLGGVTLTGGTLNFIGSLPTSSSATIIDNQRPATNLISGTFAAPFDNPSGGSALIGGDTYSYTYTGGDGNDFVITNLGALLNITTTSLQAALLNQAYVASIESSGGTSPYLYGLAFGTLPPGLTLQPSGQITGTPTAVGLYSFGVQVTDSNSPTPQNDTQALSLQVLGTDFTWTGLGAMITWDDSDNWNPTVTPPPGSVLIFPAGVSNKVAINNFPAGTSFRAIRIQDSGYLIGGTDVLLSDPVPLRYNPPAISGPPSAVTLRITATSTDPDIVVNTVGSSNEPQILDLADPNGGISYTGNLRVEVMCPSCVAPADVSLRSVGAPGSSLTIFAPNGFVESLAASHDGITRIEAGTLVASSATSLGTVTGSLSDGTEIWRGAQLLIDGSIALEHLNFKNLGSGNPPMLAPLLENQTFSGPVLAEGNFRIAGSPTDFFNVASNMIGFGDLQIAMPGAPLMRAGSDLAPERGSTTGVILSGNLSPSSINFEVSANTVLRLNTANNLPQTSVINLLPFSSLDVQQAQTIAGLTGSGIATFGAATLTLRHDDIKTFAGQLVGVNGLIAFGSDADTGQFRVTSSAIPNSASYRVDSGTLDLEGNSSSGNIQIVSGTLSGNGATSGTVESLSGSTGTIAPLLADLGTGNLSLAGNSNYEATVNGAAAGQHSELLVTGSVSILAGAGAPALNVLSSVAVPPATAISIINNDGTDPVNGSFAGLPDGALVSANDGQLFVIDYQGGDGNDVTLTKQVAGSVDVTIGDINVTEGLVGNTSASVVFTRSSNSSTFALNYALAAGTASAADFVAGSGTVNFTAGGPLTQSILVQVVGDNIVEAQETFSVVVATAPPGVNPVADGIVTILNDDTSTISLSPTTAVEGTGGGAFGPAIFTVSLSNPIQGVVSFNAASSGGTATVIDDYVAFNQLVSVLSGATSVNQNLSVARDFIVEADETVRFTLSGLTLPVGILPADVSLVADVNQLTITNDDSAQISVLPFSQAEGNTGNTQFNVDVNLSAPVQGTLTVRLTPTQLAGDSATPVSDFATGPVIVTFNSGMTSAIAALQIVGDTVVEPDETFSSVLDQITPSAGVPVASFTLAPITKVTILNDDVAAVTTTTLTISPTPSVAGQAYTARAVVTNIAASSPTGTVIISTVPASSESCTTPVLSLLTPNSSNASCQITSALPGVRTFVATYVPTGAFAASNSASVLHVVQGEVGDLQISSSQPAGVVTGQPYTISIQLAPSLAGALLPNGTIAIQHFPSPQLDSGSMTAGTSSVNTFSSTAVIKTLFVSFTDPSGVYPNRSSAFAQVVNKADVALSALNSTPQPSTVNQAVTASFVLSVVAPGAGIVTGTVTITDGVDQCIATLPATSCVITLRTAGNRTLTYRYDGNTDYNAALATRSHTVGNSANGSDVEITVGNGLSVLPQDRIVQYQIRTRLLAGDSASNVRVQAPVPAGIVSQIWSCVAENGAICPPGSTNVNGAIDALVTLPQTGSAVFIISALTQAAEGRVQFSASASLPAPLVDPNPQNNSATDNDVISNSATESGFEDE